MNNKYNQLREEIIRCCPDIIEKRFGCKIDCGKWGVCKFVRSYYGKGRGRLQQFEHHLQALEKYKKFEIIGRDIIPIDILKTRKDLAIDGLGGIFIRNHCNKKGDLWEMEYCGYYDLNKPFQDQSDECKDLLWDLICNK